MTSALDDLVQAVLQADLGNFEDLARVLNCEVFQVIPEPEISQGSWLVEIGGKA